MVHGGQKTNTIPDAVDIDVDIRTVPGTTRDDVDHHLREALGELYDQVEFSVLQHSDPTRCEFGPGNQLWDTLTTHTQVAYPGAKLIPGLIVGGTDARFYRERGKVAYGAGLFSPRWTSPRSAPASTATTNGSTPRRSACPPTTSTASPELLG